MRQQSARIIPILDARREAEIHDNLGLLDFALSDAQLQKLSDANPLPKMYPHTFWNDFVRGAI